MANFRPNISPNIQFSEIDNTFTTESFGVTYLGISGEFQKGRAFTPIAVSDYSNTFKTCFGGLNPCKFEGSTQVKYEGAYIAKEFLSESNNLFVTRVLGLSGYDAGDAWALKVGASLDEDSITEVSQDLFTGTINYVNGSISSATFDNELITDFFNIGVLTSEDFGGTSVVSGETVVVPPKFRSDCSIFEGLSMNFNILDVEETLICITGETLIGTPVQQTTTLQTCVVEFSGGSVTNNSRLEINVQNPIILQNTDNNRLTIVSNGFVNILGGEINHETDVSLLLTNCTITLGDGTTLTGNYKLCDTNGNVLTYDCDTVDVLNSIGVNITSGTSFITETIIDTTTTQIVSQIPSGVVKINLSGSVTELSGTPLEEYDNTVVALFRSYAEYANEELKFKVKGDSLKIKSFDGGIIKPLDDFQISYEDVDGKPYEYTVSLDRTKKNYIARVLGQFILCCPSGHQLYLEELFDVPFRKGVSEGKINCIKPNFAFQPMLKNYKTEYSGAQTPWVVSELKGNTVSRLFKFHTFSDGDVGNSEIKISIKNIRFDTKTFDLEVRSYGDSDSRPVILESYSRLSLSETNNNYIARRIGTIDGEYLLQSKYIMIEMAANCLDESTPSGFEGYPLRDYLDAKTPKLEYKTSYESGERIRKAYLGLSDIVGIEQDYFNFKGIPMTGDTLVWSNTTEGFHLDVNATNAKIEGVDKEVEFMTGEFEFQNDSDVIGTDYEKVSGRKFTLVPYGGFDGWDIHRKTRTNTDEYSVRGSLGNLGLVTGNFDAYADETVENGSPVITSDYYAYYKGIRTFENKDEIRINLFSTPNLNTLENSNLIEEGIEMCENDRCDVFYIITTLDTDSGGQVLRPDDVVGTIDGLYDSNYVATSFPWGQYQDVENNTYVWLPATCEMMKAFALTDRVRDPWFAAGGVNRGRTSFVQPRRKLNLNQRDILVDGRINPITYVKTSPTDSNVYIFGNKTMQDDDSALSGINVRRMMIHLRNLIADASIGLLFEQNGASVRREFEERISPILRNLRSEEAIFDYRLDIDSSAESLNSNALNCIIGIKPTRALEFINVTFVLTPVGVNFEDA